MERQMDDFIGVNCDNCGVHGEGIKTDDGRTRCGQCGQFAQRAEEYCAKHDIHYKGLYPDDNHCPRCRQERRVRDMERERMERRTDPKMHPSVDAPRR